MTNIFLADDDADDRMFFEDALKQITIPTQLTIAHDGFELMDNLKSISEPPPPNVIFLDLNMPRKNGFECLREIQDIPALKSVPVVIFSTSASDESINKTYQHGAYHYICKPTSFQLLVKAIEKVLSTDMDRKTQPPKEQFVLAIA